MRLRVRCARAIRFPTTMVATASHHTTACQAGTASNASPSTRNSAANAAAFTAVAMYPVTGVGDRKSTRLNSSHGYISYAVFCLKKKKKLDTRLESNNQI